MERKGKPVQTKHSSWPPARYTKNGRGTSYLQTELHKTGAYLLPLRLLVAIAWLWTYATRIVDPGWRDGSNLTAFFSNQLENGSVVFPEYRTLISEVFLPHAVILGWVFLVGQLVVGISLLFGAALVYTAAASARALYLAAAALFVPRAAGWEALTSLDRDLLFLLFRVTWGIAGPVALSYFVFQTAKMRSNQAATGLLYVALIFVLVGELLSAYLTALTRFPA